MDTPADKIEAHIDRTRERLGLNLRELEEKVGAVTDWREQFRARPHAFLGGAFVGGMLLAAAVRPRFPHGFSDSPEAGQFMTQSPRRVQAPAEVLELWTKIRTALIAVAATQLTRYIGDVIPGFDDHYQRISGNASDMK